MSHIIRANVQHHSFEDDGETVAIVSFDYVVSLRTALDKSIGLVPLSACGIR